MTKVFVSYSRKDKEFAQKLVGSAKQLGFDVWVDWDDIPPTVDWWDQIQKGIEDADAFLFVMSPDSIKSEVCGREIDHALQNGKRMIPIVLYDVNPNDVNSALGKLNWIFSRERDDYDAAIQKLNAGLQMNLEWMETHKRLQVRAIEWQKRKDSSLLLRGRDLENAEQQLATHGNADPNPTDLQLEYTLVSRKAVDRQRRIVTVISIIGVIMLTMLTIVSVFQANRATVMANVAQTAEAVAVVEKENAKKQEAIAIVEKENAKEQANRALAGSLAAQADSIKNADHGLALLLDMEGYQRDRENLLTRTGLFKLLQYAPFARFFGFEGPITSVAVSADGKLIAAASYNNLSLINAETQQTVSKITGEFGNFLNIAFSPDSKILATGGCTIKGCAASEGEITLWDISDAAHPSQLADFKAHKNPVKTIAFHPEGKILVSGGYDQNIILWNVANPESPVQMIAPLQGHISFVNSIAFSPDGKYIISASDDKTLIVWDAFDPAKTIQVGKPYKGHSRPINSIVFNPNGKQLASASDDNSVILWNWDDGSHSLAIDKTLIGHTGFVRSVAFNTDGTTLMSAGFDNSIILWDPSTGKEIGLPLVAHVRPINTVAFGNLKSTDNSNTFYWLSGSNDRTVIQWKLSTLEPISQLVDAKSVVSKTEAIHGPIVATAKEEQIILTGNLEPLSAHTGTINSLSFAEQDIDGRTLLASASNDQTVILWDVSTDPSKAKIFLKLDQFTNPVVNVYFDGNRLVTIENNGIAIRWVIDPNDWLTLACKATGRNLSSAEWNQYLPGQTPHNTCVSNQ